MDGCWASIKLVTSEVMLSGRGAQNMGKHQSIETLQLNMFFFLAKDGSKHATEYFEQCSR